MFLKFFLLVFTIIYKVLKFCSVLRGICCFTLRESLQVSSNLDILTTSQLKFHICRGTRIHWLNRQSVRKQLDVMPTYHYVQNQGKLIMQSRENGQKPQSEQFFEDFEVKYLQIANFSEK